MRLVYLYVRDFGIFKEEEFNFTGDYEFHFDAKNRILSHTSKEAVPRDFFHCGRGTVRSVECISALVGNNGSGKSSIARLLDAIYQMETIEHILIIEKAANSNKAPELMYQYHVLPDVINDQEVRSQLVDALHSPEKADRESLVSACYENGKNGKLVLDRNHSWIARLKNAYHREVNAPRKRIEIFDCSGGSIHFQELKSDFSFVYQTNHYAPFHSMPIADNTIDLSTSNLMVKDLRGYLNDDNRRRKDREQLPLQNVAHDYMELIRNAQFFHRFHQLTKADQWPLPIPKGATIELNVTDVGFLEQRVDPKSSDIVSVDTGLEAALKNIVRTLRNLSDDPDNRVGLYVMAVLGNWFRYYLKHCQQVNGLNALVTNHLTTFKKTLSKTYPSFVLEGFVDLLRNLANPKYRDEHVAPDGEMISESNKRLEAAIELTKVIFYNADGSHAMDEAGSRLRFNFEDKEDFQRFLRVSDLYFQSQTITHFFRFQWFPGISSGEQAQLNIYSRLFSLIASESKSLSKDVLIFLDEIEITIHPALQRHLVQSMIRFLETFYSEHRVHVIFASHSPILLSDIPLSNVCFLKREKSDVNAINAEDIGMVNTFAANIHSLYRHSFFLDGGLIGEFAQQKICSLIEEVKSLPEIELDTDRLDNLYKQIKVVGETFMQRKLLELLEKEVASSKRHKDLVIEIDFLREELEQFRSRNDPD